jgi:CheY-like chemotaxis protein
MSDKKTVFLVDDDPFYTSMLADHLEDRGYAVHSFGTGEACLAQLEARPDVIILDYYLDSNVRSAQNGLEILKIIHKQSPEQMVIMLSGQEHHGIALQTLAKGAVQYVIKDQEAFGEIDKALEAFA